jgi:prolipoprotein diacylglyceryltransferase
MTVPMIEAATSAPLIPAGAPSPVGHWVHDLHPVALDLGFFQLRWYSLAYLAGIMLGYLYLKRLIRQPGAPMARRHADDFVFYVTLGIILGGRIGSVLFYNFNEYMKDPIAILRIWEGGMSFHGGLIGSTLAVLYLARKNGLSFLRVGDYACMCGPFGLLFGRLANFVNGELWGRPSGVSWAMVFRAAVRCRATRASSTRRRWKACCCSPSCGCSSGTRAPATSRACSRACSSSDTAQRASWWNISAIRTTTSPTSRCGRACPWASG